MLQIILAECGTSVVKSDIPVPPQRPPETRDVYHDDSTNSCLLDTSSDDSIFLFDTGIHEQKDSHVQHSHELKRDAGHQTPLASQKVDQEECAEHRRHELDDTKDRSREELLVRSSRAHHGEILWCVDCDTISSGPLTKDLLGDG